MVGLDAADGKLLWQIPFEPSYGNHTTPVVDGNTVFYTGQNKGVLAVKISSLYGTYIASLDETFTTTPLWSTTRYGGHFTTPVLKDGLLYGCGDRLYCANAKTGDILWDQNFNIGQSAALVDAGSVMLLLASNQKLLVMKPGPTYTELATYTVGASETWAHPVVSGNGIYIKDNDSVSFLTLTP